MIINKLRLAGFATAAALAAAPMASAQLSSYSQDFEALDQMSGSALGDAGFLVFANVFAPDGTSFLYNYGAFAAPNGSGGFSNVTTGEGGPTQGAQGLVTFSDYNNTDHGIGNVIESLVFQEQTIAAGDSGVYSFSFDAKAGDLVGPSTASGYIRILDPNAGFATTGFVEIDTSSLPATWDRYEVSIFVSEAQAGQILQFGFQTRAANFDASGVNYDNLLFEELTGIDAVVEEDFEALDQMSPSALGDAGWLVFANVFASDGTSFLYNYGAFAAPNGSGGFSNVTTGQGGPDQGTQGLVTFSDYNNADHGGTNVIETLVFRELTLAAENVGTWVFEFDAKAGDLAAPSTAQAFIKVLDPNAGFATTGEASIDTTMLPTDWGTYRLFLNVNAGQIGQLLQVGFLTRASQFTPSGVNYDNVEAGLAAADTGVDTDGDGVNDDVDNCTAVANPGQEDSNGDGFGNRCDADLNNDCVVNPVDLGIFRSQFFTAGPDADFDSNGIVNAQDLGVLRTLFFQAPGPSALATCN